MKEQAVEQVAQPFLGSWRSVARVAWLGGSRMGETGEPARRAEDHRKERELDPGRGRVGCTAAPERAGLSAGLKVLWRFGGGRDGRLGASGRNPTDDDCRQTTPTKPSSSVTGMSSGHGAARAEVEANGLTFTVWELGGEGEPVVFLHGFPQRRGRGCP